MCLRPLCYRTTMPSNCLMIGTVLTCCRHEILIEVIFFLKLLDGFPFIFCGTEANVWREALITGGFFYFLPIFRALCAHGCCVCAFVDVTTQHYRQNCLSVFWGLLSLELTTIALGECINAFSSFRSLSAWIKRDVGFTIDEAITRQTLNNRDLF